MPVCLVLLPKGLSMRKMMWIIWINLDNWQLIGLKFVQMQIELGKMYWTKVDLLYPSAILCKYAGG
jgi:hypothetical protein